jgi:hypothetical protein
MSKKAAWHEGPAKRSPALLFLGVDFDQLADGAAGAGAGAAGAAGSAALVSVAAEVDSAVEVVALDLPA